MPSINRLMQLSHIKMHNKDKGTLKLPRSANAQSLGTPSKWERPMTNDWEHHTIILERHSFTWERWCGLLGQDWELYDLQPWPFNNNLIAIYNH